MIRCRLVAITCQILSKLIIHFILSYINREESLMNKHGEGHDEGSCHALYYGGCRFEFWTEYRLCRRSFSQSGQANMKRVPQVSGRLLPSSCIPLQTLVAASFCERCKLQLTQIPPNTTLVYMVSYCDFYYMFRPVLSIIMYI